MAMFQNNRRTNGNGVMVSLIGLGVGAAAYSMMRKRNNNNNMMEPVKEVMDQLKN